MSANPGAQGNKNANLAAVPAEIRQRILRDTLVSSMPVRISGNDSKIIAPRSGQLLATCHIIHDEALPLLYGENVFEYDLGCDHQPPTKNRFGANVKLIKIVRSWVTLSPEHTCLLRRHTALKKLTIHLHAPAPYPIDNKKMLLECLLSVRGLELGSRGPFLPELRYLNDSLKLDVLNFGCKFESPGVSLWRTYTYKEILDAMAKWTAAGAAMGLHIVLQRLADGQV